MKSKLILILALFLGLYISWRDVAHKWENYSFAFEQRIDNKTILLRMGHVLPIESSNNKALTRNGQIQKEVKFSKHIAEMQARDQHYNEECKRNHPPAKKR